MAYITMVYMVVAAGQKIGYQEGMAYIVMAYIVMAYIVM